MLRDVTAGAESSRPATRVLGNCIARIVSELFPWIEEGCDGLLNEEK
jgi:hypothetical protein